MAPKKKAAAAAAVATEEAAPKAEEIKEVEAESEVKNGKDDADTDPEVEEQSEDAPEDDEENGKEEEEPVKKGRGRKPKAAAAAAVPEKKEKEAPAKRGRPGKRAVEKAEEPISEEKESKDVEPPKRGKKKGTKKTDAETEDDKKDDVEERPRRGNRAQKINYNETTAKQSRAPKRKLDEAPKTETKEAPLLNNTVTDLSKINLTCSKKNALNAKSNFKISCWNVDGIRAWYKKGGFEYLKREEPDILCLQETKCSEDKVPEEMLEIKGYQKYWLSSEKDGYAGVALLSKIKPINVKYGIDDKEHDSEGRCITAEFKNFFVVSVYVPNAGAKLVNLPKRLKWNESFKSFVLKLDEVKPVIICGDMNVAHEEIDLANPKTNKKNAGFSQEEREGMTDFLSSGFVDTFRKFYPDKEKAYTFWTYFKQSRSKNVGWRLDYFLVSDRYCEKICDNVIRSEVFGSDHCPITLFLHV